MYIGVISQKGGVGKSTIARLIAREFSASEWRVKIADLDIQQGTSFSWHGRRLQNCVEPVIFVERFGTVAQALAQNDAYDLVILDGPPHATIGTRQIAAASDLVVLPTGLSLDDLEPSVLLAHELVKNGTARKKIVFVLCRVGDSASEHDEARRYLSQAGYHCLEASIPDKIAYRRACDEGRALTETRFASLNARAEAVAQELVDYLTEQNSSEAA